VLSHVELNERLRTLNIGQRTAYSLLLAVMLVSGFLLTTALGIAVMVVLALVIVGGTLIVPDDIVVLGFPVILAFLLTNGLIGLVSHEGIPAGQTISGAAKASLRSGFIRGFIVGAAFGFFWALIIQTNLAIYALTIGLAISLAYGLFGALSSVAEPVCLRLVKAGT
jgi:hypothetical protein